jgi:hypothetical protein
MINDIMWQNFVPLWKGLTAVNNSIMVTGGYALFLKQRWLLSRPDIRTVVNVEDWQDFKPRVTKDFDLITGIDLIASTEQQKAVDAVLRSLNFEPIPGHEYWGFRRAVGPEQFIILEFHAVPPKGSVDNIKVQGKRVRHTPSLNGAGIHGRENLEAYGSETGAFFFRLEDVDIAVPNPVSIAVMKLTAMRDRWNRSNDAGSTPKKRSSEREHAIKHAKDVFRTVAMITREENDSIPDILLTIKDSGVFIEAGEIFREFFANGTASGITMVSSGWSQTDIETIISVIDGWF